MSYIYTILYLIIVSTSVFAMDRKEAADRRNRDHRPYTREEENSTCTNIPPNKSVADIPSDSKYSSDKKK